MGARFVNVGRSTPMMLPLSIQDWLGPNDMVHFVIDAVETMELPQLEVNHRGSGSPQYPPKMMLTLLFYCYAIGINSSRKIETATWHPVPVRYLTGDTHPDHDTINPFRKNNDAAVREAFRQLLLMANQMKVLKVGTVSIDGTHIKANASKYKNIRYDRISELSKQLDEDTDRLLAEAAAADGRMKTMDSVFRMEWVAGKRCGPNFRKSKRSTSGRRVRRNCNGRTGMKTIDRSHRRSAGIPKMHGPRISIRSI